jgi:D-alanyl-D-alanine carboxypeptidase/D-alanyl-D-alanine-endopeptidase (penicillin-binding protein 4)
LIDLFRYTLRQSVNFFAEVLGKRLGVERSGRPGTIRKGAKSIHRWARHRDVHIKAYDSSGLSYSNRVSPKGITKLLAYAEDRSWHRSLHRALPAGGEGTLEDRLEDVRLRAKTGTLDEVSALSGWVWLKREGRWSAFSIMSSGMSKDKASKKEDKIVHILYNHAHVPSVDTATRPTASPSPASAGDFSVPDGAGLWAGQAIAASIPQAHEA